MDVKEIDRYKRKIYALISIMIIGAIFIIAGICMRVPGSYLTTYHIFDGEKADGGKGRYSVIEEYVGGDAYNYIIGASLIGGEIAGTMAMKAVFIVGGTLIVCIALIHLMNTIDPKLKNCSVSKDLQEYPVSQDIVNGGEELAQTENMTISPEDI